jgi:hypothetical protein
MVISGTVSNPMLWTSSNLVVTARRIVLIAPSRYRNLQLLSPTNPSSWSPSTPWDRSHLLVEVIYTYSSSYVAFHPLLS